MPILEKMVCESLNGAIYESLNGSSAATTNDDVNLHEKLMASAKRALMAKIEYEEGPNHKLPLDALKAKYIVLKPSSGGSNAAAAADRNGCNGTANGEFKLNGTTQAKAGPSLPQPKKVLFPIEEVKVGWKALGRKWSVGAGFNNMGNTCYLNSTLQALFHVPSLASWLIADSEHRERCEDSNGNGCITCAMAKVLIDAQRSQMPIRPLAVYSKLRLICKHLVPGRQEDAHEFLRYLIEAMERAYLQRFKFWKDLDQHSKETTAINQILGGYLRTTVRCLSCSNVSTTFQHFEELILDIRKADTMESSMDQYFDRERLEDMGYKCESCKKRVSATKQFTIERAPIALCVQLKRFSIVGGKLNKVIPVRLKLDLTPYAGPNCTGKLTYRLASLVTHIGASQHCGHYTAIGLTESGNYYQFDDSCVRTISTQSVIDTQAYVLFYELDQAPPHAMMTSTAATTTTIHQGTTPKPFIGPQLPQKVPANDTPKKLIDVARPSTSKLVPVNGNSTNNSKLVNNILSGSKIVQNGTKVNGTSASLSSTPKTNGFHSPQTPQKAPKLPSMPQLELGTTATTTTTTTTAPAKVNGHHGFCDQSPKKPEQPSTVTKPITNGTTTATTNGGSPSTSAAPTSNGVISLGKHTKSLVPYDCDESDSETGDTRQTNDIVVKTKAGLWTVEPQSASQQVSPSLRGSTQNCTAKSANNSPTQDERAPIVPFLLKMSHQGYGAPVASWTGDKTNMEKVVAQEKRDERKRQYEEERDLDMDRGRTKKIKINRDERNGRQNGGGGSYNNSFQSYQDRENTHMHRGKWLANRARQDRNEYENGNNKFTTTQRYQRPNGGSGGGGYRSKYNNQHNNNNNKHKRSFPYYNRNNNYHNQRDSNNYHRR